MKVDREIQKEISRNGQDGQDRIFALKLDNLFCPMTTIIYLPLYANGN